MCLQVLKCFAKFIKLFRKNKTQWTPFLTDLGADNPPLQYNIEMEDGLRNYCDDVHAMGTNPLRSRLHWGTKVDKWRKKEAGIAVGRVLLDYSPGYRQWDCFSIEDYMIRCKLAKTFEVRHLPLSDGRDEVNFSGKYKFDWAKHAWSPKKRRSTSYVKPEPKRVKSTPRGDGGSDGGKAPMIFDVELGCFVPL